MHIAELSKEGFFNKIQEVVDIIHEERAQLRDGKDKRVGLNLYPKEEVFERATEVYEEVMRLPRKSKVPQLLTSLFIKGNLISFLILCLLFLYSVWDVF